MECILTDIPFALQSARDVSGVEKLSVVCHSWGGVLLASTLARLPELSECIDCIIYLGTKRSVEVINPETLFKVFLMWNRLSFLSTRVLGYLPARFLRFGSDDETRLSHAESVAWVRAGSLWKDPRDGFDYPVALREQPLPPVFSVTGASDAALGHPKDCARFLNEVEAVSKRFLIIGKEAGFLNDYGHIDLLTHPDAVIDHFPVLIEFLELHTTWPVQAGAS